MPTSITVQHRQQPFQPMWAAGDFALIAPASTIVGELLCESLDLRPGQKALDVATGSGNTALAAARRGCTIIGIDFVPALLEKARERAAVERLSGIFQEGNAESIPFADASFDVVLSTFGVMFAFDQDQAARELLRVCRCGGKIGLTNWTPDSFMAEVQRAIMCPIPPPSGSAPPFIGHRSGLRQLLGDGVEATQITRRTLNRRYRSKHHWLDFTCNHLGPMAIAFQSLDAAQQKNLADSLLELVWRSITPAMTIFVRADYMK
ncbi:MAG: class I SAM-dependent methyltransferase [Gammaproteobacteria bacterium]